MAKKTAKKPTKKPPAKPKPAKRSRKEKQDQFRQAYQEVPVQVTPDLALTVQDCVRALEQPTARWEGNCYGVTEDLQKAFSIPGQFCYGHYFGPVGETGHWAKRRDLPFQQHAWLELPDGRILDFLRWSFEGTLPELFCRLETFDYDVGGQRVGNALLRSPPPYLPGSRDIEFDLTPEAKSLIRRLFGDLTLSQEQQHYLAHVPLCELGASAKPIYQCLIDHGREALIPVDLRRYVLGGNYENSLQHRPELQPVDYDALAAAMDDEADFASDYDGSDDLDD